MKIKEITFTNFKRFTDLKITGLSDATRLVVLVGPNGCGKSSVFDALYSFAQRNYHALLGDWHQYYNKGYSENIAPSQGDIRQFTNVVFHGNTPTSQEGWRKAIYPRTAYRNVPTFDVQQLSKMSSNLEEIRFSRFSDDDKTTQSNYVRLVSQSLENAFEKAHPDSTIGQFRHAAIGEVKEALQKIFPELVLNSLGNPLAGAGTFRFDKRVAHGFLYENLSGGEKAAFDLILDLVVKRSTFNDTVYCIDEPEAHMSTRLQKDLLACLYGLLPENCQLWIATHSIGMMRKARELQEKNPNEVAFLDFGERDFDKTHIIEPVIPTRSFWQKTYQVALDDLAELVVPSRIILCEGKPGPDGFDAKCYNKIFGDEFSDTLFVSAGAKSSVHGLASVVKTIAGGAKVVPLIDKDDKNDREIHEAQSQGKRVLNRYALENYLLDDEILHRLCENHDSLLSADDLITLRDNNIKNGDIRTHKAKNAANKIYLELKEKGFSSPGEKWESFLCEYFAPLVTHDTAIYQELKAAIFEEGGRDSDNLSKNH